MVVPVVPVAPVMVDPAQEVHSIIFDRSHHYGYGATAPFFVSISGDYYANFYSYLLCD